MLARRAEITLSGQKFSLKWDMHAIATFEKLTGENVLEGIAINVSNFLTVLWACIDADAASRDEDAPVTFRRFGTLIEDRSEMEAAMQVATDLIRANTPDAPEPGKANRAARRAAPKKKRSRSRGSTSTARSTSASRSASSGD